MSKKSKPLVDNYFKDAATLPPIDMETIHVDTKQRVSILSDLGSKPFYTEEDIEQVPTSDGIEHLQNFMVISETEIVENPVEVALVEAQAQLAQAQQHVEKFKDLYEKTLVDLEDSKKEYAAAGIEYLNEFEQQENKSNQRIGALKQELINYQKQVREVVRQACPMLIHEGLI